MNEFITNPEDCEAIMAYSFEDTKKIYKENQRLKEQLNREIHYNRIMKKALDKYANFQASSFVSVNEESLLEMIKFAQQVLKEIENKE